MRRVLLWSLGVVIIVVAGGWGALALRENLTLGTKITEDELAVTVDRGDRFSLAVPDHGASVGDIWSATATPGDVLAAAGNRMVMSDVRDRLFGPETGGGGGTRYFSYTAEAPGTVRVTLVNCFRGCGNDHTRAISREVTWTVTVG